MPGDKDIIRNLRYMVTVEGSEEVKSILEGLSRSMIEHSDALAAAGVKMKEQKEISDALLALQDKINEAVRNRTWNEIKHQEVLRETLRILSLHPDTFRELDFLSGNVSRSLNQINSQLTTGANLLESWRDNWNRFSRAVGVLSIPASLIDFGVKMIQMAESLNRAAYGVREMMAIPGAGPMGVPEAVSLEYSFKALAIRVGESEETLKRWIAGLKSSEVFFETEWGRRFQQLTIEAASGSREAHAALDRQIEQLIRTNKAFELQTGYSAQNLENFARYMSDLTTLDYPHMVAAYSDLAKRAVEVGVEFKQFEGFFKDILTTYRMYHITLTSIANITQEFGTLLNQGILTTRDFTEAIGLAKNALDPNKAGTMLWFMANFSQTQEARDIAQRALAAPGGPAAGIGALQWIGGIDPLRLRSEWERLPEDFRKMAYEQARTLGYEGPMGEEVSEFIATTQRNWAIGLSTLPIEAGKQFGEAGALVTSQFSQILGTGGDLNRLMNIMTITTSDAFKNMETSLKATQGTEEERARWQADYNSMLKEGTKMMQDQVTPLGELKARTFEVVESLGIFNVGLLQTLEIMGVGTAGVGAMGGIGALRGLGGGEGGMGGKFMEAAVGGAVHGGMSMGVEMLPKFMPQIIGSIGGALPMLGLAGLGIGLVGAIGYSAYAGYQERERAKETAAEVNINNKFAIYGPDAEQVAGIAAKKVLEAQQNAGKTTEVDQLMEFHI